MKKLALICTLIFSPLLANEDLGEEQLSSGFVAIVPLTEAITPEAIIQTISIAALSFILDQNLIKDMQLWWDKKQDAKRLEEFVKIQKGKKD